MQYGAIDDFIFGIEPVAAALLGLAVIGMVAPGCECLSRGEFDHCQHLIVVAHLVAQ